MKYIKISILIFFFSVTALFCALGSFFGYDSVVAYADNYVEVTSVTASYLDGFDASGNPIYQNNVDYNTYFSASTNVYAKNIKVTFTISGASYYTLFCVKQGGEEPSWLLPQPVPVGGVVTYTVSDSGTYTVSCSVYSSDENFLEKKSTTVRCDSTAPTLPTANSMDESEWLSKGSNFDVVFQWTNCNDTLSGVKKIFYRIYYDDGRISDIKYYNSVPADKTYVVITYSCRINVIVYDNAGNFAQRDYYFSKYDSRSPMSPSMEISPLVTDGEYQKSYTITLEFFEDNESGLASRQNYFINGVLMEYEDSIVLTEQRNYSFVFFAIDKAGNRSEYVSYELPGTAFDVRSPYLDKASVLAEIDLTAEDGICHLTFSASDNQESGIKTVALKDTDYTFTSEPKNAYTSYSVFFDCFGEEYNHTIVLTDFVGNVTEHLFLVDYFSDDTVNALCAELVELYRTTDFKNCSELAKNRIDRAYATLNYILNTPGNTTAEIVESGKAIKELYLPVAVKKYVIESAPDYVSSSVTFSVDQSDFHQNVFGNSLELTMISNDGDDTAFVSQSGFNPGFSDYFTLQVTLNGQPLDGSLENGITVSMNCPAGYLERNFALYDTSSGQKIETKIVNNKIVFSIKNTTSMALVISGNKASVDYQTQKNSSIVVFGRVWPMKSFLGVVLGVGGGAILIIVLVLLLGKKRG